MSFDLGTELISQASSLRCQEFNDFDHYIETLSTNTKCMVESAIRNSTLEGYPDTYVAVLGYFHGEPHFTDIHFLPYSHYIGYRLEGWSVAPGRGVVAGSRIIETLINECDPRVAQFCKHVDYRSNLEDAVHFVKSYIEACSSPLALELDPDCDEIGGHIHVATIEPISGFRWKIQPVGR